MRASLPALLCAALATALAPGALEAAPLSLRTAAGPLAPDASLVLDGADDRRQLLVQQGANRHRTRAVTYTLAPDGIARIGSDGWIEPLADGRALLTVAPPESGAEPLQVTVEVKNASRRRPASFVNEVVPVFTRQHCNAGACHAKTVGQNGFQLSLLGYDAPADYDQIVRHSRGRRVSPSAPDASLLLRKASGEIPHEGGARLSKDSEDYALVHRWIAEGLEFRPEGDPSVERIEVFPRHVVARPGDAQQLLVAAFFDDGSVRDITRAAQYEANEPERAEPSESGLVAFGEKPGGTAVVVRFQEHIDTFAARLPAGKAVPLDRFPESANFIDDHIHRQLSAMGLAPSGEIADGTFLRRTTLDIAGRLPTLEETKAFLGETGADKRARAIDRLLASTDYADHFAGKWSAILRNRADRANEWRLRDTHAFHAWIRSSLVENKPYDQFAAELLLAQGKVIDSPAARWYRVVTDNKERMENFSQVFLGIRMQCAQCHHHPYEQWSQHDYFSFTAFFSTLQNKGVPKLPEEDILIHNRKPAMMEHPGTKEKLAPRLLGADDELRIPAIEDPRRHLAEWMRSRDNPYFARMLVNRYWKHFFGRGLVEPEDDIRPTNPATHPELLDALAADFAASGFDLKHLIRTIANSRTYQRSSEATESNADDEQHYARYYPKRLPAEVLLDSVNDVAGATNTFANQPEAVRAVTLPNERGTLESEFLTLFGRPSMDTACECERTGEANLGQSLHLLNSDSIQEKLTADKGRAAQLAKAGDRSDEDRVSELYLRALSRKPDPEELAVALSHLEKKRSALAEETDPPARERAERDAFEDIVWVLVNTKEFLFNQ